ELTMPFAAHVLPVLARLVKRAISYNHATLGPQASPRFGQCLVIVGGIVQRGVEHGQVELRVGEWQTIELRFHARELAVVPGRGETVEGIGKNIDSHRT